MHSRVIRITLTIRPHSPAGQSEWITPATAARGRGVRSVLQRDGSPLPRSKAALIRRLAERQAARELPSMSQREIQYVLAHMDNFATLYEMHKDKGAHPMA